MPLVKSGSQHSMRQRLYRVASSRAMLAVTRGLATVRGWLLTCAVSARALEARHGAVIMDARLIVMFNNAS